MQVEYKCRSSPSNPGATLKWETHDAHDGTKSSTAIVVLFCFLFAQCSSCLNLSQYFRSKFVTQVGESAEVWTGTGWETHSSAKVGRHRLILLQCNAMRCQHIAMLYFSVLWMSNYR